jgi:L-fuconolactonase
MNSNEKMAIARSVGRAASIEPLRPRRLRRRAFLAAGAAGLFGAFAGGESHSAEDELPLTIDAHTHFYDPTRAEGVPWPRKDDAVLYRPVLPPEFEELTARLHVVGTIVIEASPWIEDNQWLLDLAKREPIILGVVGRLDPASNDFPRLLDRFAKDQRFRGTRINRADAVKALKEPAVLKHLALLARRDLELDVNGGPDLPADVARLAEALPDLRIVLNHAANLPLDGKAVPREWLAGMQAAAQNPRVYCKVSALVEATRRTNRDAPTDLAFYRPVLDALWNAFGEDRLIYGSNWPVSERAASYAALHKIAVGYFRTKGARPLAKFLRENSLAAYKPPERADRR